MQSMSYRVLYCDRATTASDMHLTYISTKPRLIKDSKRRSVHSVVKLHFTTADASGIQDLLWGLPRMEPAPCKRQGCNSEVCHDCRILQKRCMCCLLSSVLRSNLPRRTVTVPQMKFCSARKVQLAYMPLDD